MNRPYYESDFANRTMKERPPPRFVLSAICPPMFPLVFVVFFWVRSLAAFTLLAFYDLFWDKQRKKNGKQFSKVDCLFVLGKSHSKSGLMTRNGSP